MEIPKTTELAQKVFNISNEKEFLSIALDVFQFQFQYNEVYQAYCRAIGKTPADVKVMADIPFLPISFFKSHRVTTTRFPPELVFKSSGTTGQVTSTHLVKEAGLYETSFNRGFELFYGAPENFCILGLLPSYLEQGNSSLVYMVQHLIKRSGHPDSGFYLHDHEKLARTLSGLEQAGTRILIIGVTYALLDFAQHYPQPLPHAIVMETGGMKGRGKELIKNEMYHLLKQAFGLKHIHSEYGMTELLSQAYAIDGQYLSPPWMRLLLRDETDPFQILPGETGTTGSINIIDLANLYSCSFIATEDVGRKETHGFEILGRMDHTDIRGCSQMVV